MDPGLVMLAVLALSPLMLLAEVMAFRRACLPPGEGPLLLGLGAFLAGAVSGALILQLLKVVPSSGPPLNELLWGPLREEVLKAAVLTPFILWRRDLRFGLWLGAAVGLGFAAFENHSAMMAADTLEDFLRVGFERTLLCPLHGLTTAIAGAAIAQRRWWLLLLSLALHVAWNAAADVPEVMIRPLINVLHVRGRDVPDAWTLLLGVPLFAAIAALVRFARARRLSGS